MPTTDWNHEGIQFLVRWHCAPSDDIVLRHLLRVNDCDFQDPAIAVDLGGEDAVLFDSATPGNEVHGEGCLQLQLPNPKCIVRTADWRPDDETSLVIHAILKNTEEKGDNLP